MYEEIKEQTKRGICKLAGFDYAQHIELEKHYESIAKTQWVEILFLAMCAINREPCQWFIESRINCFKVINVAFNNSDKIEYFEHNGVDEIEFLQQAICYVIDNSEVT